MHGSVGVGGWYSKEKDIVTALVFKTAEKTASNAWLLGTKHIDHEQCVATMYEKGTHTFHLALNTSLGEQITSLLAAVAFEKV